MSERHEESRQYLASLLIEAQEVMPDFPKGLILLRDPDNPEMYVIVSNEDDRVAKAVVLASYRPTDTEERGEG